MARFNVFVSLARASRSAHSLATLLLAILAVPAITQQLYDGNQNLPPFGSFGASDFELLNCSAKVPRGVVHLVGNSDDDRLSDFLRRVDAGEFSEKDTTVYMESTSAIARALMNRVPSKRWKSFQIGFETDEKTGKQRTIYTIETKKGHKVRIVLIDAPQSQGIGE